MATRTIHLETTSAEELIELMKQQVELLVMQGDEPLVRVSRADTFQRERVRAALSDLLVKYPELEDDDIDEEALLREIAEGTRGVTMSDVIIEERREGP